MTTLSFFSADAYNSRRGAGKSQIIRTAGLVFVNWWWAQTRSKPGFAEQCYYSYASMDSNIFGQTFDHTQFSETHQFESFLLLLVLEAVNKFLDRCTRNWTHLVLGRVKTRSWKFDEASFLKDWYQWFSISSRFIDCRSTRNSRADGREDELYNPFLNLVPTRCVVNHSVAFNF